MRFKALTIEKIMNNMNSILHAVDMQTYDVLFANKKCESFFGDVVGKKCYEVFQEKKTKPCYDCPLVNYKQEELKEGMEFYWENFNTKKKRYFINDAKLAYLEDQRLVKIQTSIDINSLKSKETKLKHFVSFDSLTSLPNRVFLFEKAKALISKTSKNKTYSAILFIDIDNFKNINLNFRT